MYEFLGYERPGGSVGIRNHVVILPSVACVNSVVELMARAVPGAVPAPHGQGCDRVGKDMHTHTRTLINIGKNPNVAAVLVVGLGCEMIQGEHLAQEIAASGKPVEFLSVQKVGGSLKAAAKGAQLLQGLLQKVSAQKRKPLGVDKLILALKCGGSDAFSGVTANPAVGVVADWVVENGGTVILSEIMEMAGTAHLLQARARDEELGRRIVEVIETQERYVEAVLGPYAKLASVAPGNMDGGLSSIREKSLGCIVKGGSTTINGIIDFAELPTTKGLVLMIGNGFDPETVTGEVAAGAQVVIFTTGRGTPFGCPIAPVIKVASNGELFRNMHDDMDFNAGRILEGESLEQVSADLIEQLKGVLSGDKSKTEIIGYGSQLYLPTSHSAL